MAIRIETARLVLRPPVLADFDGWAAMMGDAEASRFIGGPQSPSVAWRGLMAQAGSWALTGFAMFSMIEKASGRWIGRTGPWQPEGWPGTEVGWGILTEAQGKGYAREAAEAAIDWAFDTLGWTEVIHTIDPANTPSIVLAERLGSTYRGPGKLPDPFAAVEIGVWGQSREQWRTRRAGS